MSAIPFITLELDVDLESQVKEDSKIRLLMAIDEITAQATKSANAYLEESKEDEVYLNFIHYELNGEKVVERMEDIMLTGTQIVTLVNEFMRITSQLITRWEELRDEENPLAVSRLEREGYQTPGQKEQSCIERALSYTNMVFVQALAFHVKSSQPLKTIDLGEFELLSTHPELYENIATADHVDTVVLTLPVQLQKEYFKLLGRTRLKFCSSLIAHLREARMFPVVMHSLRAFTTLLAHVTTVPEFVTKARAVDGYKWTMYTFVAKIAYTYAQGFMPIVRLVPNHIAIAEELRAICLLSGVYLIKKDATDMDVFARAYV